MDFEQQLFLLNKSEEIHSHWYQKQYPDAAMLRLSSAEHYLRFGALLGRNPGKNFDTNYYLETYSDVAMSGMNPLIHYVLFGEAEGRYKSEAHAKFARTKKDKNELIIEDIQNRIVKHLWGGHSACALNTLETFYEDKNASPAVRFLAARNAACWYYFIDEHKKALDLADLISSLELSYKREKITTMIYAYCYMALNQNSRARAVLQDFLQENALDSDMRLALANTYEEDVLRLEHINQVYLRQGLAPIERINPLQPLSLVNITARPSPVHSNLKVSVIIPTYNSADKLGIAIDSLLVQSWQNLEIIVVDDCSPDDTFQVAQEYSKKDSRVIALRQKQNGGAYIARNTGLGNATGDFITAHDGDDWSHPQKIEKQMQFLQSNPNVMGVCTHWIRAKNSLHFRQDWRLNSHLIHWSHSSFIFHRKVIEEIGGWDRVIVGGDTEFIWRVQAKYGASSVRRIISEVPMAIALDDEGSLTRSKATHVKTIHYGLRHIYRSCAQHWHKKHIPLFIDGISNQRAFAAPLNIVMKNAPAIQADTLIAADFSIELICKRIFSAAQTLHREGKTIALFHWPLFEIHNTSLSRTYFEILENFSAQPLVHGQELLCENTIVADSRILQYIPDQIPSVNTVKGLIILEHGYDKNRIRGIAERFHSIYKVFPEIVSAENDGI